MPLHSKHNFSGSTLALWRIDEDQAALHALVTPGDVADCDELKNPRRCIERLAWRAALRTMVPHGAVAYDAEGSPLIAAGRVSASHCAGWAAVVFSPTGHHTVDIEPFSRDLSEVSSRFVTPAEAALGAASDPRFATAVWCAKEAMYKFAATPGLDFLADMAIHSLEWATGGGATMTGSVRGTEMELKMLAHEDICIVTATKR